MELTGPSGVAQSKLFRSIYLDNDTILDNHIHAPKLETAKCSADLLK